MISCPHCGKDIQEEAVKCRWCLRFVTDKSVADQNAPIQSNSAQPTAPTSSLVKQLDPTDSGTIVRCYKAKSQSNAVNAMNAEASIFVNDGYHPASQTWAPGEWSTADFIVALVLCLFCIGIIVFIYMVIVTPEGTLTVTYQRKETSPDAAPGSDSKICPRCAETIKLAAKVCHFCGHEFERNAVCAHLNEETEK